MSLPRLRGEGTGRGCDGIPGTVALLLPESPFEPGCLPHLLDVVRERRIRLPKMPYPTGRSGDQGVRPQR